MVSMVCRMETNCHPPPSQIETWLDQKPSARNLNTTPKRSDDNKEERASNLVGSAKECGARLQQSLSRQRRVDSELAPVPAKGHSHQDQEYCQRD